MLWERSLPRIMASILTAQDITANLHMYGDTVLRCSVHISRGIHEYGNETVMKDACALLNSGGGLLHMKNLDYDRHIQPKDLDTWWSGMESNIADIMSGDDLCNYFDLIGNYDDRDLYLFVKSAEHLCTLDYHCRLPTDTATHEVSYRSAVKLVSKTGEVGSLAMLPPIPDFFEWRRAEETLKQEGKQIQFKHLTSGRDSHAKSLPDKIKYYCSKYISAFANHEGGHIYFGIEDTTAAVLGEALTELDQFKTVEKISNKMEGVIWGEEGFTAERGRHWDITFHHINHCRTRERRVVVVISVCKFPGGVFTACPDSYYIDNSGEVQAYSFTQWKHAILNQVRDKSELHNRFMKFPMYTPQSRLVFGLSHTIPGIKEKVLKLAPGLNLHPKHLLDTIRLPNIKTAIKEILKTFAGDPHLALSVHSLGIGNNISKSSDFVVELLILSQTYGLHLISIADGLPKAKTDFYDQCQKVAGEVKKELVHHGGCTERLGIHVHIVNAEDSLYVQNFQLEIDRSVYPPTFLVSQTKLDRILTSLVIAMATYKPHEADKRNEEYYFLLTCDQFELLWMHQFTRELWVHGPPGAGKTVAALQMIKEFERRGCKREEVLYIAENELLCSYVRSFGFCEVVTRRELMQAATNPTSFHSQFDAVCNVIVDEAQNFKDRDGDWYSLAEKLANQNLQDKSDQTRGYFWVFMDYAQKVHKFRAGLPGLIGKNNFMLSEISRNSKEIFEYASKFMKLGESEKNDEYVKDSPKLGHEDATGSGVSIVKCDKTSVEDTLLKVMKTCAEGGVKLEDMAILLGKKKDAEEVQDHMKDKLKKDLGQSEGSNVTVDTVRRFSGLDKPVVIGLDPHINEDHADINKFIVNLATRAKQGLVIITTSDDLLKKLKS